MPDWKNIKLIYWDNTLDHIARHRVSLSEVHNVLDGFFIPYRDKCEWSLVVFCSWRIIWEGAGGNPGTLWNQRNAIDNGF